MRVLALLFFCLSLSANAQNWALLNPAYKYNYSNDGTDTISNQVFVTHIDTLGPDSFRYELNRIAERCQGCTTTSLSCDPVSGILDGRPQVLGGTMLRTSDQTYLLDPDTLVVRPLDATGSTWPSISGGLATVTYAHDTTLFGIADSVKEVSFADGRSLLLSKSFGLLEYAGATESHVLIGHQGTVPLGVHYPEIIDFFDYQPGDVLQYQGGEQGYDGICYHSLSFTRKYTVLSRTDLVGRTDYTLRRVYNWYSFETAPCIGGAGQGVDTLILGVEHAHWTSDNFFANAWLNNHWPDALATMPMNSGQSEYGDGEEAFIWKTRLNADGQVLLETQPGSPGSFPEWPSANRCWDDSLYWRDIGYAYLNRYVEGVGFDTAYVFAFEHTGWIDLMGYSLNGVDHGTIIADDIILGAHQQAVTHTPLIIYPNPATDLITVEGTQPGEAMSILDATGRSVLTREATYTRESVAVGQLPAGMYMIRCGSGAMPHRFIIAR